MKVGLNKVWSKDEETGKFNFKALKAHYSNSYEYKVYLRIIELDGDKQTIVSNKIHPYFVKSKGWIKAENLKKGNRLLTSDNKFSKVISVIIKQEKLEAYNLTVEDYHTYFVKGNLDATAVWVHNDCEFKIPIMRLSGLPQKLKEAVVDTLSHINKKTKPDWLLKGRGKKWGSTFKNNKNHLPKKNAAGKEINYKEYDVKNVRKGVDGAGIDRIVVGRVEGGKKTIYYTGSHYGTATGTKFLEIK